MYYSFIGSDGGEYGSFEVFKVEAGEVVETEHGVLEPGYYWWACLPGCLPDGSAIGPFTSEAEAIANAREE